MTVQAAVGGGVLATAVGVGAAHEQASGAPTRAVVAAAGRGVATEFTRTLPATGLGSTMLLLALAFLVLVLGLLLNGLARRHQLAGGSFVPIGLGAPAT